MATKTLRVPGHKLTMYSADRITTGHCTCGWHSGECTFQREARSAYRAHLRDQSTKASAARRTNP
jgi:hypothetical protein